MNKESPFGTFTAIAIKCLQSYPESGICLANSDEAGRLILELLHRQSYQTSVREPGNEPPYVIDYWLGDRIVAAKAGR
jgi:hypothetical protein